MQRPKGKNRLSMTCAIALVAVTSAPVAGAVTYRAEYTFSADFWIALLAVDTVTEAGVPLPGGASVSSTGTVLDSSAKQSGSGFADSSVDTEVEDKGLWGGVLDFTYSSAVSNGALSEGLGTAISSLTTGVEIEVSNPSEEPLKFLFGYDGSVGAVFPSVDEVVGGGAASLMLSDDLTETLLILSIETPFGQEVRKSTSGYIDFTLGAGEINTIRGNLFSSGAVVSAVPIPAAAWLFGSGLLGLAVLARRNQAR